MVSDIHSVLLYIRVYHGKKDAVACESQHHLLYRLHITDSMHRKPDLIHEGVTLLCGFRKESKGSSSSSGSSGRKEEVITVLFDRSEFSEKSAREWWLKNRERLV